MRIVLLGRNGQLGWELQRALAPLGDVIALDRHGVAASRERVLDAGGDRCGDLARPARVVETVQALKPAVVVNAAAYTAVDRAESEPELAHTINADAPGRLAALCAESGAWLMHYSTDYVFDGTGTTPWREADPTGPLGVYGRTKLEGEEAIRASGCRHLILRTSWVHAARGVNFARTMLRLAAERDELKVVDDQVGAPTGADLLADVTAHALRAAMRDTGLGGTYHAAASGETSWFEYARLVIEQARERGRVLKVARDAVRPVPTSAYPTAARRPHNSRLDCSKLERAFALTMPDWQFGVRRLVDELVSA